MAKQKITTSSGSRTTAEEAMKHYVSIFKNSKILSVNANGKAGPARGNGLVGSFQLKARSSRR